MKILNYGIIAFALISMTSCVSKKKYGALDNSYKSVQLTSYTCQDELANSKLVVATLLNQKSALESQIDYLKKNSNKMVNVLQDVSILNKTQAESVRKSLETLSEKDDYIQSLQSAIAKKDSLNMRLALNLKREIGDINDKDININVDKGVVYIDISDKLLFNSGKYALTKEAKIVLEKVAKVLNAYPDIEFMVEGHTDNNPIHVQCMDDNWDLSVKRATSIVRVLEKEYNINPARMIAAGHSQYAPVVSNETKDGKTLNRRTRIIILPQLDQFFKLLLPKQN